MSVSTFKSVHLAERPKDSIIPGETFTLKTGEAPKESDLKDGEVLFQSLYLSLDPAMRGWLNGEFASFYLSASCVSFPSPPYPFLIQHFPNDAALVTQARIHDLSFLQTPDTRSYIPPVQIGEVMRGAAVGVVKASKSDAFPVGSYATGTVGWTELAVMPSKQLEKVDIPRNGKITDALGVLGKTKPPITSNPRKKNLINCIRIDRFDRLLRALGGRESQGGGFCRGVRRSWRDRLGGGPDCEDQRRHRTWYRGQ